ncbi:UNKNOWN [Stylonychia lemnae]|uniref:Uncharacterized protein n=1 Tax=Stylonychia lemnae TaxID=5949 RepID=A0A078A273_STYLE|nr:UNKNOWN [Stylonychia lemnae]|eukprot:CDW75603.1 UNKNOWN [Stylonychia lemnae]
MTKNLKEIDSRTWNQQMQHKEFIDSQIRKAAGQSKFNKISYQQYLQNAQQTKQEAINQIVTENIIKQIQESIHDTIKVELAAITLDKSVIQVPSQDKLFNLLMTQLGSVIQNEGNQEKVKDRVKAVSELIVNQITGRTKSNGITRRKSLAPEKSNTQKSINDRDAEKQLQQQNSTEQAPEKYTKDKLNNMIFGKIMKQSKKIIPGKKRPQKQLSSGTQSNDKIGSSTNLLKDKIRVFQSQKKLPMDKMNLAKLVLDNNLHKKNKEIKESMIGGRYSFALIKYSMKENKSRLTVDPVSLTKKLMNQQLMLNRQPQSLFDNGSNQQNGTNMVYEASSQTHSNVDLLNKRNVAMSILKTPLITQKNLISPNLSDIKYKDFPNANMDAAFSKKVSFRDDGGVQPNNKLLQMSANQSMIAPLNLQIQDLSRTPKQRNIGQLVNQIKNVQQFQNKMVNVIKPSPSKIRSNPISDDLQSIDNAARDFAQNKNIDFTLNANNAVNLTIPVKLNQLQKQSSLSFESEDLDFDFTTKHKNSSPNIAAKNDPAKFSPQKQEQSDNKQKKSYKEFFREGSGTDTQEVAGSEYQDIVRYKMGQKYLQNLQKKKSKIKGFISHPQDAGFKEQRTNIAELIKKQSD